MWTCRGKIALHVEHDKPCNHIQVHTALSIWTVSTINMVVVSWMQVHEGIMAAATYVHSNTASTLRRAAAKHPGWPLLLTGHSLGGALPASLFAAVLRSVISDSMLCLVHIDARGSLRPHGWGCVYSESPTAAVFSQAPSRRW